MQTASADIILSTSIQYTYNLVQTEAVPIPPIENKDILAATSDLSALRIPHVRLWVYKYITVYPSAVTRSSENATYYRAFVQDVFKRNPGFPEI